MKTRKFIIAALALSLATVACSQNNNVKLPDGTVYEMPSKSQVDSVSYLLGINFGSFIKGYNFGDDFNYAEMKQGILDFVNSKGNESDSTFLDQFKINPELMNDLFNSFLEKRSGYTQALNLANEKAFLEKNATEAGVKTTESGLQYKIIAAGNDVKPGPQDTVTVRYKGTLLDGTVFDEVPEDAEPITFTLNRVIPGWQEGMQLIGEGGKATLFIPSELGYGERGTQGIEPNSTLIFDVDLVKVKPYVAPEE
ncbi:MAG: FKBP-type peptidyl-prolyl cis-trans isomerase [Bacteroidia bacterium]|nr:FKBP-type peptidyl-prolyl cis-trans isomerase [Bacteroidia bacterium]